MVKKNQVKIDRLKKFLIHIYGEKEGIKRCGNLMRGSSLKVLQFKFGKEDGLKKYQQKIEHDKYKGTLPAYIERYGEVEGPKKYREKNAKLSVGTESLKSRGFTESQIENIKRRHADNSARTLENFIKQYGDKLGRIKHQHFLDNHYSCRNLKQVMERENLTESEAKKVIANRQRRGLQFYIKKYGEELGKEKYTQANKRRSYAHTKEYYINKYGEVLGDICYRKLIYDKSKSGRLDYFIYKYGEELGKEKYEDMVKRKTSYFPDFSSNIEKEFNQTIYDKINDNLKKYIIGYPITEKCHFVWSKLKNRMCVPDLKLKNIVVEFDGDYWHSKPEVIENDKMKNEIYEENNLYVIRVREGDYISNKNKVIVDVLNEIYKNIED